ncbi:MAG: hypothetical protein PHX08_06685 [Lachnospiraceae bacterium]|nr:hypothetical protein [Lachnospiraceae bacterium]
MMNLKKAIFTMALACVLPSMTAFAMPEEEYKGTLYALEQWPECASDVREEVLNGLYSTEQVNGLLDAGFLSQYREEFILKGFATATPTATPTVQEQTTTEPQVTAPQLTVFESPISPLYCVTQCSMRNGADDVSDRIAVLTTAEQVTATGEQGEYYQCVTEDNVKGFIKKLYLSSEEPDTMEITYTSPEGESKTEVVPVTDDVIGHDFISLKQGTEEAENAINALSARGADGTPNNCFINIYPDSDNFDFETQTIKAEVINDIFKNDEEEHVTIMFWTGKSDDENARNILTWQFDKEYFNLADEEEINLGMVMNSKDEYCDIHFYEDKTIPGAYIIVDPYNLDLNHLYLMNADEPEYIGGCKPYETTGQYGLGYISDFSKDYRLTSTLIETATVSENELEEEQPNTKANYIKVIGITAVVVLGLDTLFYLWLHSKKKRK